MVEDIILVVVAIMVDSLDTLAVVPRSMWKEEERLWDEGGGWSINHT